jgi:hypothetical protein
MKHYPDKCSICDTPVENDEEQFTFGHLGIIPVAFCVWCFSGLNDFFNMENDDDI